MKLFNPYILERGGQWLKGNLHMHTTNSDGVNTVEELIEFYSRYNYHFIAITDHRLVTKCSHYSAPQLLVIQGEEVYSSGAEVVGLGLQNTIPECKSMQEAVDKISRQGGISIISHPKLYNTAPELIAETKGYCAIEIYNSICELLFKCGFALDYWDYLLSLGKQVWGVASDDTHKLPEQGDRCWIEAYCEEFSEAAILKSISEGKFYSTQAPQIHEIIIENNTFKISCSPVAEIRFFGLTKSTNNSTAQLLLQRVASEHLTYAAYKIKGNEAYIRIELQDHNQKMAWTNPITISAE